MLRQSALLVVLIGAGLVSAAPIAKFPRHPRFLSSNLNERIVGGDTATSGLIPYQASLRLTGLFHICGAVIISNNWLLTAGHCGAGWIPQFMSVAVGRVNIDNGGVEYNLISIIMHPEYYFDGDVDLRNDIALLQTATPIAFTATISAVSIGTAEPIGAGVTVRASGWGTLYFQGPEAQYLQFLDLITLSNEDCRSRHTILSPMVSESTLCAYSNAIGRGMCHGDSGGPLVDMNGILRGLVSWGYQCARGRPDAYTRVSFFHDWIQSTLMTND